MSNTEDHSTLPLQIDRCVMDMISNDACVIDSNSNFARKSNYESLYFWLVWIKFVCLSRLYQLPFANWILCECVVFFFAPSILMCKMVFWIMIDRHEFEHINLWIRSDKKSISHECEQHMCCVQTATKKNSNNNNAKTLNTWTQCFNHIQSYNVRFIINIRHRQHLFLLTVWTMRILYGCHFVSTINPPVSFILIY